ncbi:DUF6529 family protein [Asanoa sp. NPDC049573]|uniref:DUF6529 family protein n=1 Tax=Asanoa sp. NPDC049573 TaxID=3155396 RepID=UPI00341ED9AC
MGRPRDRTSGLLAFLLSLPVAAACLWAFGLQSLRRPRAHPRPRRDVYGALVAKILVLHSSRLQAGPSLLLATVVGAATSSAF